MYFSLRSAGHLRSIINKSVVRPFSLEIQIREYHQYGFLKTTLTQNNTTDRSKDCGKCLFSPPSWVIDQTLWMTEIRIHRVLHCHCRITLGTWIINNLFSKYLKIEIKIKSKWRNPTFQWWSYSSCKKPSEIRTFCDQF